MLSRLVLSSLLLLLAPTLSLAASNGPAQCVTFDASWNLLAFNYDGKDYNAGTELGASAAAQDITAPNRPPFDVSSSPPLCYLSKFTNSIYVLNADASDRASVYIFNAADKSWSKQATSNAPQTYDPSEFGAILDHDTNVFYALEKGTMKSLDMALLKAASGETVPWNEVQEPALNAQGNTETYEPVLALAKNHIHFLGVPGLEPGTDRIFVIHYSYLQPEIQSYGDFPNSHGKTASFFKDVGVQEQFAYIPDDGSNTYVVNVISNTTVRLPGPTTKDPYSMYATSPNALVQLASEGGAVHWIAYNQDSRQGTTWKALPSLPAVTGGDKSSGSNGASSAATGVGKSNTTSAGSNTTFAGNNTTSAGNNTASNGTAGAGSPTSAASVVAPFSTLVGASVLMGVAAILLGW